MITLQVREIDVNFIKIYLKAGKYITSKHVLSDHVK